MWDMIVKNLVITCKIILMVTLFMIFIEYVELRYKEKISKLFLGRSLAQYVVASLLGAVPGCMDAFLVVSLYIHGLVSFGALTSVMLSTAGDEAFIMLTLVPQAALVIFASNIVLGIIGGFLSDRLADSLHLQTSQHCQIEAHDAFSNEHFLREHVCRHILLKHVPRLFFWIFVPLTVIEYLMVFSDLALFLSSLPKLLLIIFAALIGMIPESGPHMVFLILFSRGMIPFSALLVSTLSQDGHGLLPLLSHSRRDTILIQLFTTIFSLIVGIVLYLWGV